MKVALSIEISDEERRQLASRIAGKSVARLATRDEVRDFVAGAIESLGKSITEPTTTEVLPDDGRAVRRDLLSRDEQAQAERLRAEGKSEGYIRGWLAAGRKN